jgi:hypothetical protein
MDVARRDWHGKDCCKFSPSKRSYFRHADFFMRFLCLPPILLILSAALLAQSVPTQPCTAADLDATFQAADGPNNESTVAANFRNISADKCFMSSYAGPPGFIPHGMPHGGWLKNCYYCEEGQKRPLQMRIPLAPGESVYQSLTWKTSPSNISTECLTPTEMEVGVNNEYGSRFRLLSPTLLRPICSPVKMSDYLPGQFLSDNFHHADDGSSARGIQWVLDESIHYARDRFRLG